MLKKTIILFFITGMVHAEFSGEYKSITPSRMHEFGRTNIYTGMANSQRVSGVWEQGKGICDPFSDANIKIYAGAGQCCLSVKEIGGRYVFSKILFSGDKAGKLYDICSHSVMKRRQ
ncbi:MAG: hypothetical protein CBC09_01085 [Cellvibrionales bacterium TMED49]|nr:hypothetical protein [Porticoccaceae bacterium]OUU40032.1 MAG: hypothetical protein CBC09_01085 [Cellvibrionales bacterium TMED49]|tara:strand:+ start:86 stop:436 length:351 start_codon:yes stop_codon:yes gene_type:complete